MDPKNLQNSGLRIDGDIDWRRLKAPFYMRQFYIVLFLVYVYFAGGIAEGLLSMPVLLAGLLLYSLATARLFFKLRRDGLTPKITRLAMRQDLLMLGLGYLHDPFASGPTVVAGLVILLGNGLRHGPDYYKESAISYIAIILFAAVMRYHFTPNGYPGDAGAVALFTVISMVYGQFLVSRLWQSRQTLLTNSRRDDVSGLLTRRAFRTLASEILETTHHPSGAGVLLFLDLNNFKRVNDMYSHSEGDLALQATAQIIKRHCRRDDLCSRYGGDEFIIFLTDASIDHARERATLLQLDISSLASRWPKTGIGVSIGMAVAEPNQDLDSLISLADDHMYKEKSRSATFTDNSGLTVLS